MSSSLPSRREAWQRLQDAAPPEWVLRHCRCVEALAVAMAQRALDVGLAVDLDLVSRGALLHDIGRCTSQGIDHAQIGADMLRRPPPVPEPLARIVETHTGAGLLPDEAKAAGLPPRDYEPRSLEEQIVAHADNLHSGDKRMTPGQVVTKYEARGLDGPGRRIAALHERLEGRLQTDLEALPVADLPDP